MIVGSDGLRGTGVGTSSLLTCGGKEETDGWMDEWIAVVNERGGGKTSGNDEWKGRVEIWMGGWIAVEESERDGGREWR